MKHGPIALIDDSMPVVVIATNKGTYEKVISNIQEIKARKGIIIAIVTEGDTTVKELADYVIEIPETEEMMVPASYNSASIISLSHSRYAWLQCRSAKEPGKICYCRIN